MEKVSALIKAHPLEATLLGGVAVIALLYFFGSSSSGSSSGASDEAAQQAAYFNAENIQAQTGAAVQIAGINANASTAQTQLNDTASTTINSTWATTDLAETNSNNQTATSALPFAAESNLVDALAGIAGQTTTTTSQTGASSGFFGIGSSPAKSTSITTSTPAAESASTYLEELANGNFVGNG